MTTSTLSAGAGRCQPTHQLSIRPVQAVIELGAVPDLMHAALNAVHHANRHGNPDDRIAVALPGLRVRRDMPIPGHEVVLFGSNAALQGFAQLDGIRTLVRRGMVRELEVREAFAAAGESGTAFVRDRASAKQSPGALRRARERAERRGIILPERNGPTVQAVKIDARKSANTEPSLALFYGSAVVHVRAIEQSQGSGPLLVSTYGFCSAETPAILPIKLDPPEIRRRADAA